MEDAILYRMLLDNTYEGIYFVDTERKITYWNKGAERITGFTASEVIGSFCFNNILNHVDDSGNRLCLHGCPLHATLLDRTERNSHVYLHHADGYRVPIQVRTLPLMEGNKLIGAVELFIHDSPSLQSPQEQTDSQSMEKLLDLVYRDPLTELPNRRYMERHLALAIRTSHTLNQLIGVVFIDIDHFKHVNDVYGHDKGDAVLKMISRTLANSLRSTDTFGRWGGEEFVCILPISAPEKLGILSEKLRMLVEKSELRLDSGALQVTISLGCTCIRNGDDAAALVRRADELMYKSKADGRNRATLG